MIPRNDRTSLPLGSVPLKYGDRVLSSDNKYAFWYNNELQELEIQDLTSNTVIWRYEMGFGYGTKQGSSYWENIERPALWTLGMTNKGLRLEGNIPFATDYECAYYVGDSTVKPPWNDPKLIMHTSGNCGIYDANNTLVASFGSQYCVWGFYTTMDSNGDTTNWAVWASSPVSYDNALSKCNAYADKHGSINYVYKEGSGRIPPATDMFGDDMQQVF